MDNNKQLESIYNWYWCYFEKLNILWEDYLYEEYHTKKIKPKKPYFESFCFMVFLSMIEDGDGDYKIENYKSIDTISLFFLIEQEKYRNKCKNLKNPPNFNEYFPNLLKLYSRKRKEMGWRKFEKSLVEKHKRSN